MKNVLLILFLAVFLAACESGGGTKPDDSIVLTEEEQAEAQAAAEAAAAAAAAAAEAEANGNGSGSGDGTQTFSLSDCEPECDYPAEALNDPNTLLSTRIVKFGFDSDRIGDEFKNILIAHGKYLANNPEVSVRLEGHTDERGTREYNLALSEKRAQSVRRYLMLYGARSESIGVYGFGEELPLALGSTEAAWSENRRVELVYDKNN